ncbi:MAG: hypothetical protein CBB61_003535 [Gammaproteobacteria bacterium TMED1]|nr:MAG: hypothetical protein CBB61_003535 [Gammaproteobacteria bacterium TMED1]|tara:strand:+ start:152 stop:442 length:291 start_codon:yes stop_codon:yes gene_type:complete
MTMYMNAVRFIVKQGLEDDFVKKFEEMDNTGVSKGYLIKTDDQNFTSIGLFDSERDLINARPRMIGNLDSVRGMLEEISPELGVTDPVSGPVVYKL